MKMRPFWAYYGGLSKEEAELAADAPAMRRALQQRGVIDAVGMRALLSAEGLLSL